MKKIYILFLGLFLTFTARAEWHIENFNAGTCTPYFGSSSDSGIYYTFDSIKLYETSGVACHISGTSGHVSARTLRTAFFSAKVYGSGNLRAMLCFVSDDRSGPNNLQCGETRLIDENETSDSHWVSPPNDLPRYTGQRAVLLLIYTDPRSRNGSAAVYSYGPYWSDH